MEQQRAKTYEERFLQAYERLERPLVKLVLGGFVLLLLAQLLLAIPSARQLLSSTDRLEGVKTKGSVPATAAQDKKDKLTITEIGTGDLRNAWVKVNNVPVGSFATKEVTITVHDGDVVTVDTTAVPGLYRFQIDHDDPKITYPVAGTLVETNDGKNAQVGPVSIER